VRTNIKLRNRLAPFLIFALFGSTLAAQKVAKEQPSEQPNFGSEAVPGEVFISQPVEIPESILEVLRTTNTVSHCLKQGRIKAEQVPAVWFVGSQIHLNGAEEGDIIVLPNVTKMVARESPDLEGRCLLGAHAGPFWVLRNKGGKYELLLETHGDSLQVLDSITKGYRDLKALTLFSDKAISTTFRFDGEKYKPSERQEKTD
jgi:hypothetical protein